MPDQRQTKNERRAAARERAREARELRRRRDRRRRWAIQGGIGVVALGVVTAVALLVVQGTAPAGPGPRNMASGGVLLTAAGSASSDDAASAEAEDAPASDDARASVVRTKAVLADDLTSSSSARSAKDSGVRVVVYEDFQCPACRQFEATNGDYLEEAVASGAVSLEIRPISILDRMSIGNHYSTRAANAAACVADTAPDRFLAVNSALFAQQPAEGTEGRTDAELLDVVRGAGARSAAVATCIREQTHAAWIAAVSKRATTEKVPGSSLTRVSGTPTVLVDGSHYRGSLSSAEEFRAFVTAAAA